MRVCILTSTFPRWPGDSTPPFVFNLAEDLVRLGWNVEVLAPHAPGAHRQERMSGIAVTRYRYLWPDALESLGYGGGILPKLRKQPWRMAQVPFFVAGQLLSLARLLTTRPCDVVHAHWILPQGFTAVLSGSLHSVPVVTTVHGADAFALRRRPMAALKRFVLSRSSAVTVNSRATCQAIAEVGAQISLIRRIPMGATLPAKFVSERGELGRSTSGRDGPIIAFVGRLIEEKGAADLLTAIAMLNERQDLSAILVGDGPERATLGKLADRLGIARQVRFVGWLEQRDVMEHLAAADILVAPSRTADDGWVEAQSIVCAEALLVGTNVIATRTGGIPDTVIHERTGLLVDERAPDQIAAAVRRLLSNPHLAERLRAEGRRFALANLTREQTAAAFDALYREVVLPRTRA